MLILFSLATDRLNQLEGYGLARRAPQRSIPLR
jgi:DNA-binding HxlR family transcriptional regulator